MLGGNTSRRIGQIPRQICSVFGLLLLAGSVVTAAMVPSKDLAVAIATVGTFLGTAALALSVPRLARTSNELQEQRDLSRSEVKRRLAEADHARHEAEENARRAAEEITRLESMRINLSALQPILKLGLLEVETSITDFQHRILGDEREEVWWRNGYRQAYLGVVRVPVKAQLGVDLQRVRVREVNNRLVVSGLGMVTMTDTAQGATWLLDEVRTEYVQDKRVVKFRGEVQDLRAKQLSREQELQIRERLKHGQDFKVFEPGLIRTAEQLLTVLLAPLGKEILFELQSDPQSEELFNYLRRHNEGIDRKLTTLRDRSDSPRLEQESGAAR